MQNEVPAPTPPFPDTAIDRNAQGLIGSALNRIDGPAKVTGNAKYSYEYAGYGQAAYGVIVGSTIAKGRIASADARAARAMPGVLLVMTHENAPRQPEFIPNSVATKQGENRFARPRPFLQHPQIRYFGEPVALVVADTYENARDAAAVVKITYKEDTPTSGLAANAARAYRPERLNAGHATDSFVGDFDSAFEAAPVKVDATFTTPWQNHNPMELWATLAIWANGELEVFTPAQMPIACRDAIAVTLGLPKEKVRVTCKFIGGGFGGKLATESDAILAAHAARALNRPVKIAMTRQQAFFLTGHRPETIQRVRFGATKEGDLVATAMDVIEHTSTYQEFAEQTAAFSRSLYAAPNRRTTHRLVALDIPAPEAMRAPGEAIGTLAYEVAIDELAEKLGVDPIELRIRNEPARDPERDAPFGSRKLVECLREGARRFGWSERSAEPGSRRDGEWLVGTGVSAAIRPNYLLPAQARIRLGRNGRLTVQAAMTDIGTGSYTIFAQIAAEAMGVPMSAVAVEIGDSDLPPTPGSGGSFGAASVGSAILDACDKLKAKLAQAAGVAGSDIALRGRTLIAGDGAEYPLRRIVGRSRNEVIEALGSVEPGVEQRAYSSAAYGGNFAEVGVNAVTGEIRLRRMLGVFTIGRVLNEKTARSQLIGGMTWALSSALHEQTVIDNRWAFPVNHDLAEYHVPTHADAVNIDAIILPELEATHNPLKIKGVGELGICGAGAAVANAVYNASGVRVRDYPITLDKVLSGLPL